MGITDTLASIPKSDEATLMKMLIKEMQGAARPYLMNRIYGRFSGLRAQRERREMASATLKA